MTDDTLEWNEIKAAKNYTAHGVSFEAAREVFKDPFAIEWLDNREPYGEDRFVRSAWLEGRLLYVAYTMRGETIRIISARGAEPYEKRRYHEENSR